MDAGKIGHGYPMWNIILGYISHILLGKVSSYSTTFIKMVILGFTGREGTLGCLLHCTGNKSFRKCFLIGWNFILFNWFIMLSVRTFQPLIVICRMGNFVYHQWVLGEVIGMCITLVSKVFLLVFLFVGLSWRLIETFIELLLVGLLSWVSKWLSHLL